LSGICSPGWPDRSRRAEEVAVDDFCKSVPPSVRHDSGVPHGLSALSVGLAIFLVVCYGTYYRDRRSSRPSALQVLAQDLRCRLRARRARLGGLVPGPLSLDCTDDPARLCLRSGFICFTRIAQGLGVPVPDDADPATGITLTHEEFAEGVARLKRVGFPIEREPEKAWPNFVGWRVDYERAADAVA
jgi:hypothetical protein